MSAIIGLKDNKVSQYNKVYIKQGGVLVVGALGDASRAVQANWNSPFEGDNVGSKFSKTGGMLQSGTLSDSTEGMTSVTTLSSQQTWAGNQPTSIDLTLRFYALTDAKSEVVAPIEALECMISPQVNEISPVSLSGDNMLGRAPEYVIVNIGRMTMLTDCVLESISYSMSGPKNATGHITSAEVQITLQTATMLNRSEIAKTYG